MDPNLPVQPEVPAPPVRKPVNLYLSVLLLVLILVAGFMVFKLKFFKNISKTPQSSISTDYELAKFSSFEEFKNYMQTFSLTPGASFSTSNQLEATKDTTTVSQATRVSETNVQVKGIDEADIVKTDGKDIYYSGIDNRVFSQAEPVRDIIFIPESASAKTKVIGAFPLSELAKKTEIDKSGDLLLADNVLVVLSNNGLYGYDVSDSSNPKEIYQYEFDSRNQIISSRLVGQDIFLALRIASSHDSCVIPLTIGNSLLNLNCTEIYRPNFPMTADSIYTVLKLDLKSGQVKAKNSFVGTMSSSVYYQSENSLYLTYSYAEDYLNLFYDFYLSDGKDLITSEVLSKLKNLRDLDLSTQSKYMELSIILENYKQTLGEDELLRIENETKNKLTDYLKKNVRSLEKTGIVKLSLDDLNIQANGTIPGKPLNQFSLDEYLGVLRIAQNIGVGFINDYSVNDVYLLDDDLQELGKITDLGMGERIYSARFIGNLGYVVTFRETDPFYVLDLSQPKNPQKVGELKIPGYSSYLHPLTEKLILGIGKENQNVKLSLFDVGNPSQPVEIDKYNLDEYWSEVLSTHKAFLQDEKYQLFFVPGGKGGYLFSYENNSLKLTKAVSLTSVQRALFINDYLYLLSSEKIVVLDEKTGETLKTLSL